MKRLALVSVALTLSLSGCSSAPPPAPSASSPGAAPSAAAPAASQATPPSGELLAQVTKLKGEAKDGKWEYKVLNDPANGPAFLAIAQEGKDGLASALEGLSLTYTLNPNDTKKNHPTPEFAALVLAQLDSKDPLCLYFALKSAQALMGEKPDRAVVDKLVQIVTQHTEIGARMEAQETLFLMKDYLKDPAVAGAFLASLQDKPAIQSNALFRLRSGAYDLPNKKEVFQAVLGLVNSEDPGVRGRAWQFLCLATDQGDKAQLIAQATKALEDKHPFTRSAAAEALAEMAREHAVKPLMKLLGDKAANTYEIEYPTLRGQKDSLHHDGSPWSRVDDATLYALESATAMLEGDLHFDYGDINYKQVDQDIAREVKHAQDWFQKNQSKLGK